MSQDPQDKLESYLKKALSQLEKAQGEIEKTQLYSRDLAKFRLLVELTREQVQNENTNSAARAAR